MIDSRLASFLAFGEELNFTRAAARLHLSQPALHVQIRKLAEDVGDPLYRRVGRALELTPAGRELLGFGRELRDRTDSFLASLRGASPQRVVLAAGEGALLYSLGPAICPGPSCASSPATARGPWPRWPAPRPTWA
jgi:DNA-binding transcriptional LysR family regulator